MRLSMGLSEQGSGGEGEIGSGGLGWGKVIKAFKMIMVLIYKNFFEIQLSIRCLFL